MITNFIKTNKGVAAVEFALILPILIFLFFGTNEITRASMAKRKVENVVRVVTDLAGQYSSLRTTGANNDVAEIFAAAKAVFEPYDKSKLHVRLIGVEVTAHGAHKVLWSFQDGAPSGGCSLPAAIPSELLPPTGVSSFIIFGQADYDYDPITHIFMSKTMKLSENKFWLSRSLGSIKTDSSAC